MYLRVLGAFLVVGHTLHFNTEHGKTLVQVPDLFGSVLVKKKSNRKWGVSLNESSRCLPILSEAVWSYASLLFFLPSVPWPRVAGRIGHDTGEAFLSPSLCALRPAEELRHPEPSGPRSPERPRPASAGAGKACCGAYSLSLGTENTTPQAHPVLMSRDACWHLPNSTSPEREPFSPPRLSVSPWK